MPGFLMSFYTEAGKGGTYTAWPWGPGCGVWGFPSSCDSREMWREVEDRMSSCPQCLLSSVLPQAVWVVGPCIAEVSPEALEESLSNTEGILAERTPRTPCTHRSHVCPDDLVSL